MEESVSASDANRRFSLLLRRVRDGCSFLVTSHGKAVARIVPATGYEDVSTRARTALLARLEQQPRVRTRAWTRDELYDD